MVTVVVAFAVVIMLCTSAAAQSPSNGEVLKLWKEAEGKTQQEKAGAFNESVKVLVPGYRGVGRNVIRKVSGHELCVLYQHTRACPPAA